METDPNDEPAHWHMYAPSSLKYMTWVIYTGQVTISVLWKHWFTDHLMLYISHMVSINPITFLSQCTQKQYTSLLTDKWNLGSFCCVNTATVYRLRKKINWYKWFVIQLGQIYIRYHGDTLVSLPHRLEMNCHLWPTKHTLLDNCGPYDRCETHYI